MSAAQLLHKQGNIERLDDRLHDVRIMSTILWMRLRLHDPVVPL